MKKKIIHYDNNFKKITIDDTTLDNYINVCNEIAKLQKQKEEMESNFKSDLKNAIEKLGKKNYSFFKDNYELIASVTSGYTKNVFNTSKFKEEHTKTYWKYTQEVDVDSSIKLSIKHA